MQYQILSSGSLSDLERQVRHWIGLGWTPLGGLAVGRETRRDGFDQLMYIDLYVQALTKPDEVKAVGWVDDSEVGWSGDKNDHAH